MPCNEKVKCKIRIKFVKNELRTENCGFKSAANEL